MSDDNGCPVACGQWECSHGRRWVERNPGGPEAVIPYPGVKRLQSVYVRKTGARAFPWEARCRQHPEQETYLTDFGAVAFNTRGIGNRLWQLAILAALEHVRRHHTTRSST